MNRMHRSFAATLATVVLASGAFAAQTAQAPPMKSVLAGKKVVSPAKGEVRIEYTDAISKRTGNAVITTVEVKNIWNAPIARLTLNQTWFDDKGAIVTGNKGFIDGVLQPGEIGKVVVETPYKAGMSRPSMKFTHAYGSVKEMRVKKLVPDPVKK